MEDRIYFNIESRTEMVKMQRLRIRENEKGGGRKDRVRELGTGLSWTYGFRGRTINHVKGGRG